ncbi:MAG: polyribonucleotide nucleotidyltransferase [Candidatus Pacebacteria bacterium]|nr:polyribonucleotide nucleotidyltransferase [Candidatus Paceibacterota bacterium]MCF7857334.1 polyribonucleotide nucleotidyltransferase [Candidatus Paceibacterota bacterium]
MEKKSYSIEIAGKTLTANFTDLTNQAHGSVMITMGETVVLVTAVMSSRSASGMSYFPLSVEFEEKFYATGQILGSRFQRREGRPSDGAVLSARMIDRTVRPLFNHALRNEIQVIATVLSAGEDDPDVLSIIGASLALGVSDIPWAGPIGAVRIGKSIETGGIIINPTYLERATGLLSYEVLVCGQEKKVNMIESAGFEISEDEIGNALDQALLINEQLEVFQKNIITEIGKIKRDLSLPSLSDGALALFTNNIAAKLKEVLFSNRSGKVHLYELKDTWLALLKEELPDEDTGLASEYYEHAIDETLHHGTIHEKVRPDGRGMDDVRSLFAQAGGISPALHGSGIFYRGETHIFAALTLGGPDDSQILDSIEENGTKKNFMHHYNFPPFSVGETGRIGGTNRRMIGHGALAEKALAAVIPSKTSFPYTIRLVSETMASNGSSSMGSVCASTLALMDGGVPITRPVAGIASGLMMENHETYQLITDIQGPEDEHGDMDFKVAGTREGITAIQMDVKVGGIPVKILREALEKARLARMHILDVMEAEIQTHRADISPRAPKIIVMQILPDQIGLVIGGGGKTINGIKDETGVDEITIEDDGTVYITGKGDAPELARTRIADLTKVFEIGERFNAEITRVATFGAFARLTGQNEGLIHISEIVPWRLENLDGILAVGDRVDVIVSKVEDGKIGLSIKKADPEFARKRGLKAPEKK